MPVRSKPRRSDGWCAQLGCPVKSGDKYHCDKHAQEWAAYMRQRRKVWRRRANAAA